MSVNLKYLYKSSSGVEIFNKNCISVMEEIPEETVDLIFADPPYELYDLNIFVENALKKLNEGGMLIIECSSKETLEGFDKIAKFGDTNLLYWKV